MYAPVGQRSRHHTASYHNHTNVTVEHQNSKIASSLRAYWWNWPALLPSIRMTLHKMNPATGFVTGATWRVPHVENELFTLPEHLSSPPVFNVVRFARSLVFYVMFCCSLFVLLSFFFLSLCCLSFELRLPITPLVSSNISKKNSRKF